jgi:hypothetical protein
MYCTTLSTNSGIKRNIAGSFKEPMSDGSNLSIPINIKGLGGNLVHGDRIVGLDPLSTL